MPENVTAPSGSDASRRALVGGFVGLGIGAPLLAACGSGDDGGSGGGSGAATPRTPATLLAPKNEIPVGGGKIFPVDQVVLTQPKAGEFKAFSAVCTHQGCVVAEIKDAEIDCTCHGSRFSITDGSVLGGPATKPLEQLKVTATGEDLSVT